MEEHISEAPEGAIYLVDVDFMDKVTTHYQNVCKRAKNLLDFMSGTTYTIEKKGSWKNLFRPLKYKVNVFGEIEDKYGNQDHIPEYLLQMGKISTEEYQLIKFYDVSDIVDHVLVNVLGRVKDGHLCLTFDEFQMMKDIGTFEEDPNLTYEEIFREFEKTLEEEKMFG